MSGMSPRPSDPRDDPEDSSGPGQRPIWVPSKWLPVELTLLLGTGIAAIVLTLLIPAEGPPGFTLPLYSLTVLFLGGAAVLYWASYATRGVWVLPDRICVVRYWGELNFHWSNLRPISGARSPTGEWGSMRGVVPGQVQTRRFLINRDQAREILAHPSCPPELWTENYARWLGSVRTVPDRTGPS